MQETDRPASVLFTRNRQAGADDNLAEAIALGRLYHGSLRFDSQVCIFEFRVFRDGVEGRRKTTRERSDQQILGRPPAFDTTELWRRGEVNCVRGRFRLGESGSSRGPPGYHSMNMFLFHEYSRSGFGISRALDDSVSADRWNPWRRSRLEVTPITHTVLQYAPAEGSRCVPPTA